MLYNIKVFVLLDTSDYPDPTIFDSESSRKKFVEGLLDGSNAWPSDTKTTIEQIPEEDLLTR